MGKSLLKMLDVLLWTYPVSLLRNCVIFCDTEMKIIGEHCTSITMKVPLVSTCANNHHHCETSDTSAQDRGESRIPHRRSGDPQGRQHMILPNCSKTARN